MLLDHVLLHDKIDLPKPHFFASPAGNHMCIDAHALVNKSNANSDGQFYNSRILEGQWYDIEMYCIVKIYVNGSWFVTHCWLYVLSPS